MAQAHEHQHRSDPSDVVDVVVVGGGAAGLAAALQLGRSRRSVVVVDAGEPRNAPAAEMHSYLGHDGRPPGEFLAIARDEVRGYGVRLVGGTATGIIPEVGGTPFRVDLGDGTTVLARRVLAATGLVDELPDIPGVAAQWGHGVIHCPYCHGWEVQDRRIVVVATSAVAAHQALLFRQLSDRVTVAAHEPDALGPDDRRRLAARGIQFEAGPVAEVVVEDGAVCGVRLADGTLLPADAVVVAPRFVARSGLLRGFGIETEPAPMGSGEVVPVDARGATVVPGLYAAGNVADVSHQVLQAAAEGARVGAVINADLAVEEADAAAASLTGDRAEDWDRRYGQVGRWWSGRPNASLVTEVDHLDPGTAVDVGCGEGADAVWLAQRGWRVTGLDISGVALDKCRRAADGAGVEIDWQQVDLGAGDVPTPRRYDLVAVHYPSFRHAPGDPVIRWLLDAVAPGGTLLVVGHDLGGQDHGHHGIDPADYVQPADVARLLDDTWAVEVHESRPRTPPPGHPLGDVPDVVLRARRVVGA